ncbi:LysR family transcriptional regulator [Tamaricihabitans halophyticus]|uniref:LysR family transcriptional regulator n=1 Tax=Tamaricihabitans halophyticus TaxID=1262583 RepID=A0A4V2SUE2_9PSEU|nr:LysR family transcriptional regulator [Tamaricihabitans halophyticus]TCP54256.1 LysR family transcriptional regulator [Tamaricihabitans halophyticus]
MVERRQLEYFLAVAEEGSFSRAASQLGVAQPTLSQAIATLEGELDTPLFFRLPRGVQLTSAGQAMRGPARQALRAFENATEAVVRVRELDSGVLDVGCPSTLAAEPLAQLIGAFHLHYPGVLVHVHAPESGLTTHGLVESGQAEIGVTVGEPASPELVTTVYDSQPLYAFLPPGTAISANPSVREVLAHGLVATERGGPVRRMLEDLLGEPTVTGAIVAETDFEEAVIPLVHAGAGACFAPAALAAEADRLGLVAVATEPEMRRDILVAHRHGPLSPSARAFLQLMGVPG